MKVTHICTILVGSVSSFREHWHAEYHMAAAAAAFKIRGTLSRYYGVFAEPKQTLPDRAADSPTDQPPLSLSLGPFSLMAMGSTLRRRLDSRWPFRSLIDREQNPPCPRRTENRARRRRRDLNQVDQVHGGKVQ